MDPVVKIKEAMQTAITTLESKRAAEELSVDAICDMCSHVVLAVNSLYCSVYRNTPRFNGRPELAGASAVFTAKEYLVPMITKTKLFEHLGFILPTKPLLQIITPLCERQRVLSVCSGRCLVEAALSKAGISVTATDPEVYGRGCSLLPPHLGVAREKLSAAEAVVKHGDSHKVLFAAAPNEDVWTAELEPAVRAFLVKSEPESRLFICVCNYMSCQHIVEAMKGVRILSQHKLASAMCVFDMCIVMTKEF
jgi:hypothetical protein